MIGRRDDALRLVQEYDVWAKDRRTGLGDWAFIHLAMRDETKLLEVLNSMVAKAQAGEADPGYWALLGIKLNLHADSVLEQAKFAALRDRLLGD